MSLLFLERWYGGFDSKSITIMIRLYKTVSVN